MHVQVAKFFFKNAIKLIVISPSSMTLSQFAVISVYHIIDIDMILA